MAPKKGASSNGAGSSKSGKGKHNKKQGTQARTPKERIVVIGPTGKRRLEWREWGS